MTKALSKVEQIIELRNRCSSAEEDKLEKLLKLSPRTLALAFIQNTQGKILVDTGYDSKKNEKFYRLIGGGVRFLEAASMAVVREIKEETGIDAVAHERLGVLENIFTFEGDSFHEIIFVFRVSFSGRKAYERVDIPVSDSSRTSTNAVWKEIEQIKAEGAKLYPEGLTDLLPSRSKHTS